MNLRTTPGALLLPLLAPAALADVHVAVGGPVAIPDVGTVALTVDVPDDTLLRDVNVMLRVEHPTLSSLSATLRHPDGSKVTLFQLPAADGDLFLASFDDEAAMDLVGSVPSAGSFRPAVPLDALDGKRALGTWTLELRDVQAGAVGELGGFALAFDGRTYVSADAPQPIPSSVATLSTLQVPDDFTVLDVELGIDIAHAFFADVSAWLQGPGAFTPQLFGFLELGPGMVFGVLDDESPTPVDSASSPYTGRFAPQSPGALSALDGAASQGNWYLSLFDSDLEDDGTLLGWWLHLVTDELPPVVEPCAVQQVLDDGTIFGAPGAVDVDGGRLFVGVPQGAAFGGGSGEAQVFERDPATGAWTLVQTLVGVGGKSLARFGQAVSADGGRLAVGATGADGFEGNVTIFERVDGTWTPQTEIALPGTFEFGRAVHLAGDRLAVGEQGRAHVFELQGGAWTPVLSTPAGAHGTVARAVALAGAELLVGDPDDFVTGSRVLVYPLDGSPPTTLTPSVGGFSDQFGHELSVSGDAFATGAWAYDGQGSATGAAFVFRRGPGGWAEEALLEPTGLEHLAQFGDGVALVGDTLWVSASGFDQRNLRRYQRGPNAWVLVEQVDPPAAPQLFGETIAADEDWVLAGALLASEAFALAVTHGSLTACTGEVSVSAGGQQSMEVDAGPAHAGDFYVLVGTTSGTSPALAFGALTVPIVVDAYTLFLLGSPGAPPLIAGFGTLDTVGRADAGFALPPGSDPALAGLHLNHAVVVLDAVAADPVFASTPLALRLTP